MGKKKEGRVNSLVRFGDVLDVMKNEDCPRKRGPSASLRSLLSSF